MSPKEARQSQAKREERLARYQQVVTLRKQGLSQTAIAEQVGIGHATVSCWLERSAFPEQQPRPRKTSLDPHLNELAARWEAGCHNIAQLHRELVADGYTHSYHAVYEQLVRLLPEGRKNPKTPASLPRPPVLARHAVFLFLRRLEKLSVEEQETLLMLRQFHPEVDLAYDLVQQFVQMLHERLGERLDSWLAQVDQSSLASTPVLCRRSRERQRGGESRAHLVDQQWCGRGSCDQAQTHQKAGIWPCRIPIATQACPSCRVDGDCSAWSLLTFNA